MKHKMLLFFAALLMLSQITWAYDFSYTYQGKTLFYTITDSFNHRVSVVNPTNGNYYSYITGDLVIPDSVEYNNIKYAVTSIGESAFSSCSGLTSVIIPNSVTYIGNNVFQYCSGLTTPNTYW